MRVLRTFYLDADLDDQLIDEARAKKIPFADLLVKYLVLGMKAEAKTVQVPEKKKRVSKQHRRNELVFTRLLEMSAQSKEDAEDISLFIEDMLDDMRTADMFGTENQLDPRGQITAGSKRWSIELVKGID